MNASRWSLSLRLHLVFLSYLNCELTLTFRLDKHTVTLQWFSANCYHFLGWKISDYFYHFSETVLCSWCGTALHWMLVNMPSPVGGGAYWIHSARPSIHLLTMFVLCAVSKALMLQFLFWVCGLPIRSRCAWACHFAPVTFDLEVGHNLEILKNLGIPAVGKLLMLYWPIRVGGPLERSGCAWACHCAPITFDLADMTLILEILYQLLCPNILMLQLAYLGMSTTVKPVLSGHSRDKTKVAA